MPWSWNIVEIPHPCLELDAKSKIVVSPESVKSDQAPNLCVTTVKLVLASLGLGTPRARPRIKFHGQAQVIRELFEGSRTAAYHNLRFVRGLARQYRCELSLRTSLIHTPGIVLNCASHIYFFSGVNRSQMDWEGHDDLVVSYHDATSCNTETRIMFVGPRRLKNSWFNFRQYSIYLFWCTDQEKLVSRK